ncbi:MAG: glycerophosphodiester phosphodiesterase [Proteobacteria bacterium]|nr:glycerophosphodiester phosphodiesterase [Pseudomonadota bacterium]
MSTSPPRPRPFGPPIVIAHRGASGYLPEHTLVAKAYAHALGTDYLEQDVVLTRDDVPVVFHDLVLDEVTDVAERYAARRRDDGHWYVIDFDYAELATLAVRERIELPGGTAAYPGRFPERLPLRIQTLAEELALVRGLNHATGRRTGVYTEVKSPAFHRRAGKDPSVIVLATLAAFGYRERGDACYLQCFDAAELARIRFELGSALKLVQLVGENDWRESDTDYDDLRTPAGLARVAAYADGIGPWIPQIVRWPRPGAAPEFTTLVADAHAAGLAVHPYTFRLDQLPEHAPDATAVQRALFETADVDGLFSDFCDATLAFLGRR